MTTLQPRALAHRGVVDAAGFLFDSGLIPEDDARERILRLWTPGAAVHRLPEGLILRLATSQCVSCGRAPGAPLRAVSGALLAMPLDADEMRSLAPAEGAVVLARGGSAVVRALTSVNQEDPAQWLDTRAFQTVRMQTLGDPPPPPRDVGTPEPFDPRAKMGAIGEAPERGSVLDALRRAAQGRPPAADDATPGGSLGNQVSGLLSRLASGLKKATEGTGKPNPLSDLANRAAARLLAASGFAGLIGRKHADYVARMMEMFERGDLDAALRHAISLGEMDGSDLPPAPGTLNPRDDLRIPPHAIHATSGIDMPPEIYERLEHLYRQAFLKLEREGRIEEAAFVLSELLKQDREAVAFLERHRRLRLAAELAESREMEPGRIVRLWFLAGDAERAIRVARKHKAFADAIQRLEKSDPAKAQELRLLWAASLAEAGDYGGAFDAVYPVLEAVWQDTEIRAHILAWIEAAIDAGGPTAARMLAHKLVLVPERQDALREQIVALLEDEEIETAPERLAFARTLVRLQTTPLTKTLARATARAVLRDADRSYARMDREEFQRLLRFSGDGPLRADAPALSSSSQIGLMQRREPLKIPIPETDCGILPIYDAAFLSGGRCLVALGEMGARLLNREGKPIVHWEQPAHRLIVADNGERALALAPRGDIWRIARLDFAIRKAEPWCEASLRAFAPDYDGALWFVAFEQELMAIDTLANDLEALWRLPRLGGKILMLARSELQCAFLLFSVGVTDEWGRPSGLWTRLETCTYSLPSLYQTYRHEIAAPPDKAVEGEDYARALAPGGTLFTVHVETFQTDLGPFSGWKVTLADTTPSSRQIAGYRDRPVPFPPVLSPEWMLIPIGHAEGVDCYLFERRRNTERGKIRLRGASRVAARFTQAHLTLADDRGRLLVLDLERGELVRDLRLR